MSISMNPVSIFKPLLPKICESLLKADADILAIVQFGSSIYAPESARDLDLLIFTCDRKIYDVYDDAITDFPLPIDLVPHSIDRPLGGYLAASVIAWGRLLYGDRNVVERMTQKMPVPTFHEARTLIANADADLQTAQTMTEPILKEGRYRTAFNGLFDCARLAAMAYLNTDQTRWGELRRQLPEPYREQFRQIINHLHIDFFYDRALPTPVEAEYQKWRDVVLQFIDNLEKLATQATDS
ncbi:hypothetical protein HYR99_34955 [Candidatus Poribacteria bacterium]|nr:hypothetical protein [Candidatus Poribacteria bacterium]